MDCCHCSLYFHQYTDCYYIHTPMNRIHLSKTNIVHLGSSFIDIPVFYFKHLAMHNMQIHAGAIKNIVNDVCVHTATIHSLKLVDYLPVQTHNP